MLLQKSHNPLDLLLVGYPDCHHRGTAFQTPVVDRRIVVRLASKQAAPKALRSRVCAVTGRARCCLGSVMTAYGLRRYACGFQISHGSVCMSCVVEHSDDDLIIHYFFTYRVSRLFKARRRAEFLLDVTIRPPFE